MTGAADPALPRIPFDPSAGDQANASLVAAISQAIAQGGPAFLAKQRWFGDKSRTITRVHLDDLAFAVLTADEPERFALAVTRIQFSDGLDARYFLPVSLIEPTDQTVPSRTLAILETPPRRWVLQDASHQPAFHTWLLDAMDLRTSVAGGEGSFDWTVSPAAAEPLAAAHVSRSRLSSAEQSNSAVIYGESLLLKLFRKLRSGTNPDIEISRFLTEESSFTHFPSLLADLTYRAPNGDEYAVAMALPFIPNRGDAWSFFQARLGEMLSGTSVELDTIAPLRVLGRRTGQLHAALAEPTADLAFQPEPVTAADIDRWTQDLRDSIEATLQALQAHLDRLPPFLRQTISTLDATSPLISHRLSGFTQLLGTDKTRVHGDYHLGQVLATHDEDFVILDFEGEPSRTIEERRAKTSPLKDIAGMLRSIAYARAAAAHALPDSAGPAAAERLATWERDARDAFLAGYREETFDRGVQFLPSNQDALEAATAAWELDKALYEVHYELNNRPDWLSIPLSALLDRPTPP